MRALAEWLSTTAPSVAVQSRFWFIRVLQATHLLTAGVASVSGLMIALRVLGLQRPDQPYAAVWARFAPWLVVSFSLMLLTGIAQTLGDPVREFTSFSYWLKLVLVIGCAIGTLLLARAAWRTPPATDFKFAAKLTAAAFIVLWLSVVLLGRMIAYDRAIWGSLSMRT